MIDMIKVAKNEKSPIQTALYTQEALNQAVNDIKTNINKSGYVTVSQKNAEKIIDLMRSEKYGNSRWAMINAITEVAQEFSSIDDRLGIERYAGSLLAA